MGRSSHNTAREGAFSYSCLPRCRSNVLDLITIVAPKAIATTIFCDVDMTFAEELRAKLLSQGKRVTETALLLKAIGIAQRAHPASRSVLLPWGQTVTFEQVAAGFTIERYVGSQPVVFFGTIDSPDVKPLESIAAELRQYAQADVGQHPQLKIQKRFSEMPWILRQAVYWLTMRCPKLRLRYMPATFGFTSLGKYGIKFLNGPCICTSTFGVGAVEGRAVVRDKAVVIRPMMTVGLIFDRRVIGSGAAARLLRDVKELMEGKLEEHLAAESEHDVAALARQNSRSELVSHKLSA